MNIFIKKIIYLSTRAIQALFPNNNEKNKIVYYPQFTSNEEFADQYSRIAWYLPKSSKANIYVAANKNVDLYDFENIKIPEHHRKIDHSNMPKINFYDFLNKNRILNKSTIICVWKLKSFWELLPLIIYYRKIRIVDPEFYLFSETHTYPAIFWYDIATNAIRKMWKKQAENNYKNLYSKFSSSNKAYVFGTGPSIESSNQYDFTEGVKIICNSMVKNDELLQKISPNIVVFLDSVFHFGVSKYAEEFNLDLLRVVKNYEVYCITNQIGYSMMRLQYPQLTEYLISIPAKRFGKPVILNKENFYTRDYTNVLTRYMLPLAAGLTKKVFLLGFDGRNPDEKYFWKHNTKTQYTEEMDSTKLSHPAFFNDISYTGYYEKHINVLERMIIEFENKGIEIRTLTSSFIPVLIKRIVK